MTNIIDTIIQNIEASGNLFGLVSSSLTFDNVIIEDVATVASTEFSLIEAMNDSNLTLTSTTLNSVNFPALYVSESHISISDQAEFRNISSTGNQPRLYFDNSDVLIEKTLLENLNVLEYNSIIEIT